MPVFVEDLVLTMRSMLSTQLCESFVDIGPILEGESKHFLDEHFDL